MNETSFIKRDVDAVLVATHTATQPLNASRENTKVHLTENYH